MSEAVINNLLQHYEAGRLIDAEKLALSIIQEYPNYQFTWKILSIVLQQLGRISESLVASEKSVELMPQDAEAHYNLGNILRELGRFEEAETSYRQAVELKPDYAEAHNNRGNTLAQIGRLDEAETSFRQVITFK